MKLFSEKVEPTFTSSNLNILTVEDFQEVFFDVFEFEINGKKFVAEKISEYKGLPVIDIPLVLEGKEYIAPFVVQRGKFEILFNRETATFVRDVEINIDNHIAEKADEIEEIIFEKKEDILREITQARQSAEKYAEKIKQQKINEAENYLAEEKKAIRLEVEESKKNLIDEFLTLVENTKSVFYDSSEREKKKLTEFIESSVSELADRLVDSLEERQEVAEKRFKDQLDELATNILSGVLLKEISSNNDKNIKDINERFTIISNNLKSLLISERDQIDISINSKLEEFNESIISLEKANVDLNDHINKGDNRALSRIGNVKTHLEDLIEKSTNTLIERVDRESDKIKSFYDQKISLIEEKVDDITTENKQYFLNLINESKQSLLNEISNIKVDVPNIVIERSNGKKEVDLKGIKSELEKIIGARFSNELQSLKRLIEMSSGGGSVAKQFANGGTMNGDLNVTGRYLSGGVSLVEAISDNTKLSDLKDVEIVNGSIDGTIIDNGTVLIYNGLDQRWENSYYIGDPFIFGRQQIVVTDSQGVAEMCKLRLYQEPGPGTLPYYSQINPNPSTTRNTSYTLPLSSGTIATNHTVIEIGDARYGTYSIITQKPFSSISTNFATVASIVLQPGLYQIDGFLASIHTVGVGCKIRFGTSHAIKVGLTDNYGRPSAAAFSWPIIDDSYIDTSPYSVRSDSGAVEYRRTITGIIEVLTPGTTVRLDYAQLNLNIANPSVARSRTHLLARKII